MPLDRIDAIAFDVYGTLVDVTSLATRAQALGLPANALVATWRAKQLEYSFVRTLTGDYVDFWQVTRDALDYACASLGVDLADDARERLCREWLALDPFPEVPQALAALGSRPLVVLSNGSPAMLDPLLERSGLRERFREVLSVDEVGRYKPDPAVYALPPAALATPAERILFVSANGFDVAGAKRFGYPVCRVDRAGAPLDRLGQVPDATVPSLAEIPALLGP